MLAGGEATGLCLPLLLQIPTATPQQAVTMGVPHVPLARRQWRSCRGSPPLQGLTAKHTKDDEGQHNNSAQKTRG